MLRAKIVITLYLFFQCYHTSTYAAVRGCTITLPKGLPKQEPVILIADHKDYTLFKPLGQQTTFPIGTKLILACTGNKNAINSTDTKSLELKCGGNDVYTSADGQVYDLLELGCRSIPSSTLRPTTESCADGRGNIFEVGFALDKSHFAKSFIICYDNATEHAFYTKHILNGAAIRYDIKGAPRRSFSAEGMKLSTTRANIFYTLKNQLERFLELFGEAQQYIHKNNFLARGHLTPDADFVFSYEQLATYYYANVAPEFQIVNSGNWLRVENAARSLASKLKRDLEIFNGHFGILSLKDINNNNVQLHLDAKRQLKVPKYFFKVIKDTETDSAIVFITLNSPFGGPKNLDNICPNVCAQAGAANPVYNDFKRGYTFCCSLSAFKKYYKDLPSDLNANSLLNT